MRGLNSVTWRLPLARSTTLWKPDGSHEYSLGSMSGKRLAMRGGLH
jgi:hypothetical protein